MKKLILAIVVVAAVSATSCKKDAEIAPKKEAGSVQVNGGPNSELDKSDLGSWD